MANVDMKKKSLSISMSFPDINDDDVRAVTAVLRSGQLALGPQAVAFERLVADYAGVKHGTWATISAVVIRSHPTGRNRRRRARPRHQNVLTSQMAQG